MKCKFNKICENYRADSQCCKNENMAKHYYGVHRPVECYQDLLERQKRTKPKHL